MSSSSQNSHGKEPLEAKYDANEIYDMIESKSLAKLRELGGVEGLAQLLETDLSQGLRDDNPVTSEPSLKVISGPSLQEREELYGVNRIPLKKTKTILELMWLALQDKVLIILSIAAVISLALGIYEDVTSTETFTDPKTGKTEAVAKVHWIEGFAIVVAILIVVLFGAFNDWQKERQFQRLNAIKDDRKIKIVRDGTPKEISTFKLLVGDLICLEPGDILPVDAVLVTGHHLRLDESGITGESDAVKKRQYDPTLIADLKDENLVVKKMDPFLISGSKVLEGVGTGLVVAVGTQSFNGRLLMSLQGGDEETPLQEKLNHLAETIAKLGFATAILMLLVLLIEYFIEFAQRKVSREATKVIGTIVRIFISAVTVVVVAVPEGLPLAVTLALAFATTRMLKDNNLVRVLSACETMANANIICSDKTGTLTQNKMTVVAGVIGDQLGFGDEAKAETPRYVPTSFLTKELTQQLKDLLYENISVNSNAFYDRESQAFVGSKTETALLAWIEDLGSPSCDSIRRAHPVEAVWPFSSSTKSMTTAVKTVEGNGLRVHVKGASEIILGWSDRVIDLEASKQQGQVVTKDISKEDRRHLHNVINEFASNSLRTIGLAYREVPLHDFQVEESQEELVLIGIVGIQDPLRPGVIEAVKKCQRAGVQVKMVTGDNILTAQAIATQCGIHSPGGLIMEGPVFRRLSPEDRVSVIQNLQVLARSSPEDKRVLVESLKKQGNIVAVTGDGTNDGPALRTANVGFSMGIAGTEVAKEASSIVLMDDNFASIVKAIIWGRCVNDAVRKFIQFQLTVNVTAVSLTFISAVASVHEQRSVLTAVQLLWVNLIMDTMAALALATDPADETLLDRKPETRRSALISADMWKMILIQSAMQVVVCLGLLYGVPRLETTMGEAELYTLVFNTFVWMQIFNEINCRRIDNKLNVFAGITRNYYFVVVMLITVMFQFLIVHFGGPAFQTVQQTFEEWLVAIGLGLLSFPVGLVARLFPHELIFKRTSDEAPVLQEVPSEMPEQWRHSAKDVRDQLMVFRALRGGGRLKKGQYQDGFAAAAVMPSLIASAVGIGFGLPRMGENEQLV